MEVELVMLVSEESLILKFFCLQAVTAPAFASSFLATIGSPRAYFFVPLSAIWILTFIFFPLLLLLGRRISLVKFTGIEH